LAGYFWKLLLAPLHIMLEVKLGHNHAFIDGIGEKCSDFYDNITGLKLTENAPWSS
jgi:hypothetical protein